jgi:hypothetical protein
MFDGVILLVFKADEGFVCAWERVGILLKSILLFLDTGRPMVGCDGCHDWFHYDCVGFSSRKRSKSLAYFCPNCKTSQSMRGPTASTTMKGI